MQSRLALISFMDSDPARPDQGLPGGQPGYPSQGLPPGAVQLPVIREREIDLFNDHSVALEFVRELASTACEGGCICDHPDEQPCIHCRAAKWLHSK
jgi:hypothetical protein